VADRTFAFCPEALMSSLESSESPPLQAGLPAGLQALTAPADDSCAPQTKEWQPVAALRSAPQDALALTLVAGMRDWVTDIQPQQRHGLAQGQRRNGANMRILTN